MSEYIRVASVDEVIEGAGKLVEIDGQEIALFKSNGEICAIHNLCPHAGGPLSEGGVRDGHVMCPWHGWEFNLKTGACAFNPAIKVPVFKTKKMGNDILIEL